MRKSSTSRRRVDTLTVETWYSPWKFILSVSVLHAILYGITRSAFIKVPEPLEPTAPPGLFSEGRAMEITRYLAETIGDRQTSTKGESLASSWLFDRLEEIVNLAKETRPDLEVTALREQVTGAVSKQRVFHFEIANVYNNLTNIILHINPISEMECNVDDLNDSSGLSTQEANSERSCNSAEENPIKAVLINAHYDSPMGSPGASDCASCVGIALEIARTIVANPNLRLSSPIIVLLNGGEETLMQASHGFMASSEYSQNLGAFINIESTGSWGPDVLFQHSGDWTLGAYAKAAPYPKGNTVGQDFFDLGIIPADTDYRMLSWRQYGSIPGIDVAFLFGGSIYHTREDTVERIRPGTIQAMGENLLNTVLEFSTRLKENDTHYLEGDAFVYFDVLAKFMVIYSYKKAIILHSIPLVAIVLLSLCRCRGVPTLEKLIIIGIWELMSFIGCVSVPFIIGFIRVAVTGKAMAWYSKPLLAQIIFISAAKAGLLIPESFPVSKSKKEEIPHPCERGRLAALGFAFIVGGFGLVLTLLGVRSSYLFASWAAGALLSATIPTGNLVQYGWKFTICSLLCFVAPIVICLPTSMSISVHLMEKIGIIGSFGTGILALSVPDFVVGGSAGIAVALTLGAVVPYVRNAINPRTKKYIVSALILFSLGSSIYVSVNPVDKKDLIDMNGKRSDLPYTTNHPKRIIVQHIHRHAGEQIVNSLYSFASLDPILVDKALNSNIRALPDVDFAISDWIGIYPLNYLISGISKLAPTPEEGYRAPSLKANKQGILGNFMQRFYSSNEHKKAENLERWYLELDTVQSAWAVLNLSADIQAWSIGPEVMQIRTKNIKEHLSNSSAGVYSIVRYASGFETSKWSMWIDVPKGSQFHVDLYVKWLEGHASDARGVFESMPSWTSPSLLTTWISSWDFE